METKYGFTLMSVSEFDSWLKAQQVSRIIGLIQNHHTYLPDYTHFTGRNHFERLQSMKHYHMVSNGWSNIAQTFTTFPDGTIAACRPLNDVPVGIKGHNSRGICIEHFGNFDAGKDQMSAAHRDTIIKVNALLCRRFNLPVDTDHIVYHHWYDLNSGLRRDGLGVTKSCPGTAFFGGNKVADANAGFIPLIKESLSKMGGSYDSSQTNEQAVIGNGIVTASSLYIRTGPGTDYNTAGSLSAGSLVDIYESKNGWLKIAKPNNWVAERHVIRVEKKKVKASSLYVRSGPGGGYSRLGALPKDTEVLVYENRNGWSRVDINEKWVSSAFLV